MDADAVLYRVLVHLPVWTADEPAYEKAEIDAGAARSIRAYTAEELTDRLGLDVSTPDMELAEVQGALEVLAERDQAQLAQDGWRMTQAGLDFILAPGDGEDNGADVGLNPSSAESA